MENPDNFDNYEEQVLNPVDDLNTDVKINPDFYIHRALVNAQQALLKEDMRQGFLQYWGFIEHIELLCSAAGILPSDYQTKIDTYMKTSDYANEPDNFKKSVKLANIKLKLMMSEVFHRKTITEPMKVEFKKELKNNVVDGS